MIQIFNELLSMKTKAKKIYIANNIQVFGGTLALSTLCANLRNLGYDARLIIRDFQSHGNSIGLISWYTNIKRIVFLLLLRYSLIPRKILKKHPTSVTIHGLKDKLKFKLLPPYNKKDSIIIYPEIIWGNPLGIKNTVRWLLYHHKYYEGKDTYCESDYFVTYRDVFNDEKLNPLGITLKLNYFDNNLYRRYNFGPREGNCYILRKGTNRKDLPAKFDGPVFNNNMSDEEFVEILNNSKYCFSYDTQTFYSYIAAICGCISIVVMEPGKTESDYLSPDEKHYGVAYGNTPEQIEYALSTIELLKERLNYEEANRVNTQNFVEYLKSVFGEIKRI